MTNWGFMKHFFKTTFMFFFGFTLINVLTPLSYAQTEEEPEDNTQEIQDQHENEDEIQYLYTENRKGDQYLRVGLGPMLPLNFGNPFSSDGKLKLGGMGALGYHYFIAKDLAVGIDVGFGFNATIGSNVLNYVPVIGSITYQPVLTTKLGIFEFPITVGVGFAWETYAGYTYWPALVVKPQLGAHYRINASWSVGVDVNYMFMPQFTKFWGTGTRNYFSNEIGIDLVARYYF